MDEVEKLIAAEIIIPLLIAKLENLKDKNQITDPRLVSQVEKSIEILTEVEKYLEDKDASPDDLNPELLQTIYRVEDDIDIFLVRTRFQKPGVVLADIHLKYVHIQTLLMTKIMKKLVSDLEKKWTVLQYQPSENAGDKRSGISDLEGRVKELAELILTDYSSPFPIPVIDVEGSATTTELRKIFNHVQVKDRFDCLAWVAVPQEFDKSQLLIDIIKQVGVTPVTMKEMQGRLHEQQLRNFLIGKKYLVIFIDVRTPDLWEIVKYAFPKSSHGSRVISSFRAADAVRYPNIIFYGRKPDDMQVSYAATNVAFDDNATTEQVVSGEDLDHPSQEISDEETNTSCYGAESVPDSCDIQVSSAEINVVGDDIVTSEQPLSNKDPDQLLPKAIHSARDKRSGISNLEGRVKELAELILTDYSTPLPIPVIDVEGSATTTELRRIYNHVQVKDRFDCRAWVAVPQEFDRSQLLIDIIKQVGVAPVTIEEMQGRLYERQLRNFLIGKKYLVIFIDVRTPDLWEIVKYAFPKSPHGSRVISSFRAADAVRYLNIIFYGRKPDDMQVSYAATNVVFDDNAATEQQVSGEDLDHPSQEISDEETNTSCYGAEPVPDSCDIQVSSTEINVVGDDIVTSEQPLFNKYPDQLFPGVFDEETDMQASYAATNVVFDDNATTEQQVSGEDLDHPSQEISDEETNTSCYGAEPVPDSCDIQVSSAEINVAGDDIVTFEQPLSNKDLDQLLPGVFDEDTDMQASYAATNVVFYDNATTEQQVSGEDLDHPSQEISDEETNTSCYGAEPVPDSCDIQVSSTEINVVGDDIVTSEQPLSNKYPDQLLPGVFDEDTDMQVSYAATNVVFDEETDTRCYGPKLVPNSCNIRVPSVEINVVGDDIFTSEQPLSNKDSDEETDIVGLKDKISELAKLTLSDEHSVLVVVGDAGSGKTTLVKTVYDNSLMRQSFGCHAWVNVYLSDHSFDKKNVLISILKQLKKLAKDEEESLPNQLETRLTDILSGKKFLIVLDDVHLPSAWYDFQKILLPKSSSGSRVILITRKDTVAQSVRKHNVAHSVSTSIVQLRLLNKYESCQLFLKMARKNESPALIDMKEMVWKICGGLPLGVCVLGGLFSTGNYSSLIESARLDEGQSISSVSLASYIWKFAYKNLSPRFRAYIHYLCLFPKSDEIPVRRLFHLWLAERLVTPSGEEELEELVNKDIEDLENMRIIQVVRRRSDGKPKTCNVTSSLYDTFCQNSHNMGSFHVNGNKSNSTSNLQKVCIRRFAEHRDIQNNPTSDESVKHLHSFISFNTKKGDKPSDELGNFLNKTITKEGIGLLRVLDLEKVYKPILPETLGKHKLLRYVGLRWTFLDTLPTSIGDLPCLETLDLKHTNITKLPMSIWRSKTLKHLYLNRLHFKMSTTMSVSLTNLQTLRGLFICNIYCCRNDWLENLSCIRNLGLTCHTTSFQKITKQICKHSSLQSLKLRLINNFGEPSGFNLVPIDEFKNLTELYLLGMLPRGFDISLFPPKLQILTLSLSQLSNDPMPILGKLEDLNTLRLFAHSYIGEQLTCPKDTFRKLHVLKLWVLKELKHWTINHNAMPVLKQLEIRYCQKLKKIDGLENVRTWKEIILTNMEKDFVDDIQKRLGRKKVTTANNWTVDPTWDY